MTVIRSPISPVIFSPLRAPTALYKGGEGLLQRLLNPSKPLPAFIDLWRTDGFGFFMALSSGTGIPTDSLGQVQLEYTVSGASGASSLTIGAGDESKGTGQWIGVVQHDDDSYGLYVITSLTGGACNVFPNLRAAVTAKVLRNVGGSANNQHYTEPAYRALASQAYARTHRESYRSRYAAKWSTAFGAKEDWTAVNIVSGQYAYLPNVQSAVGLVTGARSTYAFVNRGMGLIVVTPGSPYANKGVSKSFALGGRSGVLEIVASAANLTSASVGGFKGMRVLVTVDAVSIHDVTYTENDGLETILIDYPAGDVGVVQITIESATAGSLYVGDITWWTYDRTLPDWDAPVFDKDAKIVVMGDSHQTFYSGAFCDELQSLMTGDGGTGTVVSVAVAGETAEDGLAAFDARVMPEAPDQVVIPYFTNDRNEYAIARWQAASYEIGIKCQAIGAKPIYIGPFPTSSYGQSLIHGNWADQFGVGLPI